MTGAEVYITSKGQCLLGKVRHDGDDVEEFFTPEKLKKFTGTPQELWKEYRAGRKARGWENDPEEEIDTQYQDGFVFSVEDPACDPDMLPDLADDSLAAKHPDGEDGYFCGYSDHMVIITQTSEGVYIRHEEEDVHG